VQTFQNISIVVSNVPGATSYNVYLSSHSCAGPFGNVANIPVTSTPQNNNTSGCPFGNGNGNGNGNNNGNGNGNGGNGNGNGNPTCSLGAETLGPYPLTVLPFLPLPNLFALPFTFGAYPPDAETAPIANGLPNQNPDRAVAPAGDRANENECVTVGGSLVTCAGPITPGAVAYYIPSGACLSDPNGGDNYVFSGYQFNWMAIYEPGFSSGLPANTCSNVMGASTASAYIGLVYTPAAAMSIPTSSGFRVEATGGVIADTVTFTGQLPTIAGNAAYMPVPPAAKLTG
jgi:hypothetical protein